MAFFCAEEPCAVISLGDQADTDAAVAAAKAALPGWSATPPAERARLVEGILAQHERRKEEMAQAISLEMGAPIELARNSQAPCLPWHTKNFLTAFKDFRFIRPLGPHAPNDRIALEQLEAGDRQLAAEVEQLVLNDHQQLAHIVGQRLGQQDTERRVELIDIAH